MFLIQDYESGDIIGKVEGSLNVETKKITMKDGVSFSYDLFDTKTAKQHRKELDNYIYELFDKIWVIYPKKTDKIQSQKTWYKKLKKLKTNDKILGKAKKILLSLSEFRKIWINEDRKLQFIPSFSAWLNSNIPD